VDLQLRPSGSAGPVAVNLAAFERYYEGGAETWEFLALTRGRVVWASTPAFFASASQAIEAALRRPHDRAGLVADVLEMRALMARERPPSGFWDLKLAEGGQVDIEFAAQAAEIAHAAVGGPLCANTGEALAALETAGLIEARAAKALSDAWRLQQDLSQVVKVALADEVDPGEEPPRFKAILARAGGARGFSFKALVRTLVERRAAAHAAFLAVLDGLG
jgi:glutamate-ammonia-ligase adenylyltransferase